MNDGGLTTFFVLAYHIVFVGALLESGAAAPVVDVDADADAVVVVVVAVVAVAALITSSEADAAADAADADDAFLFLFSASTGRPPSLLLLRSSQYPRRHAPGMPTAAAAAMAVVGEDSPPPSVDAVAKGATLQGAVVIIDDA